MVGKIIFYLPVYLGFRLLTPCLCLMQLSRPVCCPLMTKEPMQRCKSKFVRSFTWAKGRSPWAPSASILCPGPNMAALVQSWTLVRWAPAMIAENRLLKLHIQEKQKWVYSIFTSDTRYGVSAGRFWGGWDGTSAGHHAKCGCPMDAQAWPVVIWGPEERMSVNSKERDSEKKPTSRDNVMDHLWELIHQSAKSTFCTWSKKKKKKKCVIRMM